MKWLAQSLLGLGISNSTHCARASFGHDTALTGPPERQDFGAGMAELKADVLVLGAGMVGVSAALRAGGYGTDQKSPEPPPVDRIPVLRICLSMRILCF